MDIKRRLRAAWRTAALAFALAAVVCGVRWLAAGSVPMAHPPVPGMEWPVFSHLLDVPAFALLAALTMLTATGNWRDAKYHDGWSSALGALSGAVTSLILVVSLSSPHLLVFPLSLLVVLPLVLGIADLVNAAVDGSNEYPFGVGGPFMLMFALSLAFVLGLSCGHAQALIAAVAVGVAMTCLWVTTFLCLGITVSFVSFLWHLMGKAIETVFSTATWKKFLTWLTGG